MSIHDRIQASSGPLDESGKHLSNHDWQHMPELCELIEGVRQEAGDGWVHPPATLMIFLDEGTLKFCVSQKKGPMLLFGTIECLQGATSLVCEALQQGLYENKTKRARK